MIYTFVTLVAFFIAQSTVIGTIFLMCSRKKGNVKATKLQRPRHHRKQLSVVSESKTPRNRKLKQQQFTKKPTPSETTAKEMPRKVNAKLPPSEMPTSEISRKMKAESAETTSKKMPRKAKADRRSVKKPVSITSQKVKADPAETTAKEMPKAKADPAETTAKEMPRKAKADRLPVQMPPSVTSEKMKANTAEASAKEMLKKGNENCPAAETIAKETAQVENSGKPQTQVSAAPPPRKSLKLEPSVLRWKPDGGIQTVSIQNMSQERHAVKVKCSDNQLYRVNPVYSFVEPGQTLDVDILRQHGPAKVDKMVFVTAKADDKDFRASSIFEENRQNALMVLPLIAQNA